MIKRKFIENNNIAGVIFLSPWLTGFLIFTLVPLISSFYFSFTKYDLFSEPKWIDIQNFIRMFKDELFIKSFLNTFYLVFVSVPLRIIFALYVAMILLKKYRFINFYRLIYYLPTLLGGSVAISVVWKMIFGDRGPFSLLLFLSFGIKDVSLVGHPNSAMWTIIALMIWQFGSSMIIFMAGIKNIPTTYYEAAVVDGANGLSRFIRITIPLLSPVILFNLIMQTINSFIIFTQVYIITLGGPGNSTLVYSLYMFNRAFRYFDMGYASAMAWVLLIIIAIFTFLFFKTSKYWVYYESGE